MERRWFYVCRFCVLRAQEARCVEYLPDTYCFLELEEVHRQTQHRHSAPWPERVSQVIRTPFGSRKHGELGTGVCEKNVHPTLGHHGPRPLHPRKSMLLRLDGRVRGSDKKTFLFAGARRCTNDNIEIRGTGGVAMILCEKGRVSVFSADTGLN